MKFLTWRFPIPLKRWLRQLSPLLTFAGFLSCGAATPDWQTLKLPDAGELRLRHSHVLATADTAPAVATAQTLIRWTRDGAWNRLRVRVDARHPLVVQLKAGPLLMLTPDDASLPIIWLSLEPGQDRAVLEDRRSGALTINARPPGKSVDLGWLGL